MKKRVLTLIMLMCIAVVFSGCAMLVNILDPLPEEYVEGLRLSRDYPDDDFELYDDAIVFDQDEDDEEINLLYGTTDDMDDVIDFYEDLFDDNDLTVDETEDDKDEFYAKGSGDGFLFEVTIEEPKGKNEERAFATVVEVKIEFYTVGQETLMKMQGFWQICGDSGMLSDDYRLLGMAIDFGNMQMDFYDDFIIDGTNISFTFIDDDTINYTVDGDEYTIDVSFETIDGKQVMTLTNVELNQSLHLEKTTLDDMKDLEGPDLLPQIQGFWLACGFEGAIDDTTRMEGVALDIGNMVVTVYTGFEALGTDIPLTIVDEDTFTYTLDGAQIIFDVVFETVAGIPVLSLDNGDTVIHFEPSTYTDMLFYADMGGEEGGLVYLTDVLTDDDLEYWITDINWYFTYEKSADGQYTQAEGYNRLLFNWLDYTGEDEYLSEFYYITWEIVDSMLYIYYDDGTYYQYLIDFEYDGEYGYLYLLDPDYGWDEYGYVYTDMEPVS